MSKEPRSPDATGRTASGSRRAELSATLTGGCVNPVRLRGIYQRISAETGEVLAQLGSAEQPCGTMLVACKDRRSSCCAVCARLYQRDAYHLLAAGLRGGKTVPPSVGTHPAVMLTLTAPSFGVVHGNRNGGRPCKCGRQHQPDDPQLGAAIDPDSYRYADQVIWNHLAPELWKRTVQAIRRVLAQTLGIPRAKLTQLARVRFAKVAEFQRRGVVHYHAVIRVDGPNGFHELPPPEFTTELLERVVTAGADAALAVVPAILTGGGAPVGTPPLRWGAQRELAALDQHTSTTVARYIAKYATKATETATGGGIIKPIRSLSHLSRLELPDHARRLIVAAWATAERTGLEAFKRWAHQFGYGGHTLTKSHQYSVTFADLRAARANWHQHANDEGRIIVRAQLTYAGRAYPYSRSLPIQARDG